MHKNFLNFRVVEKIHKFHEFVNIGSNTMREY